MVTDALVERAGAAHGPAIVVLVAGDVRRPGPDLTALLRRATPGRPVLIGGTDDRAVLTEAINRLRVVRVVPDSVPVAALRTAILAAHEAVELEVAVDLMATNLRAESARLADALAQLRYAQAQLLHTERLGTLGRLTSSVVSAVAVHQTDMRRLLEGLHRVGVDPEVARIAALAEQGTEAIGQLLAEIDAFASDKETVHRPATVSLQSVVDVAVAFSRYDELASGRSVTVEHGATDTTAALDRVAVYHIVLNLVRNALQATRPGGRVEVRTSGRRDHVLLEVEDNGSGMSKEVRDRLFQPFFSTRGASGLGLGLRTCRAAVERHGGTVEVGTESGRGTRVTCRFPRV